MAEAEARRIPWKRLDDNSLIALGQGEHLTPEYPKLNPNGVVPTLLHDGDPIMGTGLRLAELQQVAGLGAFDGQRLQIERGIVTRELLEEHMRRNHVRHDALQVLARTPPLAERPLFAA